jgi:nucleoside-diphosphate-sugar epimerase
MKIVVIGGTGVLGSKVIGTLRDRGLAFHGGQCPHRGRPRGRSVQSVRSVRMRWIGHRLHADAELDVDPTLSLAAAHRIAHDSEHDLIHALPKLTTAVIHAYPAHES